MRFAIFAATFLGVLCAAFTLIGICCALYTGESIWEPIVFGAVSWPILTTATIAINALGEWVYRVTQR